MARPEMIDLDALVPDPLISDRQRVRFYQLDISGLEDVDLVDEFHCLRPLLWHLPADHWLRGRVGVLEAEIMKRGGGARTVTTKRQKPKPAEGVKL